MPKLIRLISGADATADFSNFFQEDIRLKKNSRVALQSISLQLDDKNIQVDATNNTFDIQVARTAPRRAASLIVGKYNTDTFLSEINRAINSALVYNDRNGNYDEFQCVWSKTLINSKKVLNIQWNTQSNDFGTGIKPVLVGLNVVDAANNASTITKTGADGNWDYLYAPTGFSRGVGTFSCMLSNANNSMDGVCVGFLANQPEASITGLPPSSYVFAIYSVNGRYRVVKEGNDVPVPPATAVPTDGDRITFILSQGTISLTIGATPIATLAYTYPLLLHGAVSCLTDGNQLEDISITPSPYMVSSVAGQNIVQYNEDLQNTNYSSNVGAAPTGATSVHSLYLTPGSQNLLGFGNAAYSYQAQSGVYAAIHPMIDDAVPSSLIIECPSLHLNSYDGAGHRRRNILAVVPALDTQGNNQFFMPSYPIYIDLHNADEQIFNNIQMRVLDNNNFPVPINPDSGCVIAVLIDSD